MSMLVSASCGPDGVLGLSFDSPPSRLRRYWSDLEAALSPGIDCPADLEPEPATCECDLIDQYIDTTTGSHRVRQSLGDLADSRYDPALWARSGALDTDYARAVEREIANDSQVVIDYSMRYSMQFGRFGRLMAAARFATPRQSADPTVLDPRVDLPPQISGQITAVRCPRSRLDVVGESAGYTMPAPLPADGTIRQEQHRPHEPVNYTSALPHDDTHPSAYRLPYGPLSAMLRRLAERIEIAEQCGS